MADVGRIVDAVDVWGLSCTISKSGRSSDSGHPPPREGERGAGTSSSWQSVHCTTRETRKAPTGVGAFLRVTDGTRTRDSQDHNLVLYQLNYGHHRFPRAAPSGRASAAWTILA
ncbi:hypothetical protein RHCRD62_10049 [Rhodococcus sp. RD6.2]|nr:hypothetical protein RHCRD62_10049 [Rhodococcus sp. RD6.2]